MKLEDFNSLTDEEKAAYLQNADSNIKAVEDLTAERDSFKNENSELMAKVEAGSKELKATKELNFTLARHMNVETPAKDVETVIYEFIKENKL